MSMTADEARKMSKTAQQQRVNAEDRKVRQEKARIEEEVDNRWHQIVEKLNEQIVNEACVGSSLSKTTIRLDDNSINQALRARLTYHYRDLGYGVMMKEEKVNYGDSVVRTELFLTVSW